MSEKKIEDLTNKELLEDLHYYVDYAQKQSPSFVDKTFNIVYLYIKELRMWIYLLFIVINKYNGYRGIHSNSDKNY